MIHKNTKPSEVLALAQKEKKSHEMCKFGSGFLTEEDMTHIAHHLGVSEAELKETHFEEVERFCTKAHKIKTIKRDNKPFGQCIFLKNDRCEIKEVMPFHCRISNHGEHSAQIQQWFDLNFFVDPKNPNSIREYAQVLKVRPPIKGGALEELVPDKNKLNQILKEE